MRRHGKNALDFAIEMQKRIGFCDKMSSANFVQREFFFPKSRDQEFGQFRSKGMFLKTYSKDYREIREIRKKVKNIYNLIYVTRDVERVLRIK